MLQEELNVAARRLESKAKSELMMLVVTAHRCFTGSGGALGLLEDVGVKIDDLGTSGASHMEVAGGGIATSLPQDDHRPQQLPA